MPASFAGVALSLGDPGGAVQAFIDRHRPLDDIVPVCTPAAYRDGRARPQGAWPHSVGLPTFNWNTRPPRWRINSLWWPTGASRFAVGLFLTTLRGANDIQDAISGSGGSGTLVLSDGVRSLSTSMYALPMRPLGAIGPGKNPVVLLPLVDWRYFWQGMRVGATVLSPTSTWAEVLAMLTALVGSGITSPTPEDYPAPDWSEFARYHESAALALDGFAASAGQRFVADLVGGYGMQTASAAHPIAGSNIATIAKIAGGECLSVPGRAPGQVSVAFPWRQGGVPSGSGKADVIAVSANDFGFSSSAPGDQVIHTTFQSDRSSRSASPDNLAAMQTVANAIARDFYGWRRLHYSATLPGVASSWVVTGYDDYVWFQLGTQVGQVDPCDCDGDGDPAAFQPDECEKPSPYLAQTLVESLPPNFGVEENLTQTTVPSSPRTFRPMPIMRAELTSNFEEGSGVDFAPALATARLLYSTSDGVLATDQHNVRVFDTMSIRGDVRNGNRVWVSALAADSDMFELVTGRSVGAGSNFVVFQLLSVLQLGGAAQAVICTLNGGIYVPDGAVILVADAYTNPGCWAGQIGYRGIAAFRGNNQYDVVFMERPALITDAKLSANFQGSQGALLTDPTYYQHGNKEPPGPVQIVDPNGFYPRALKDGRALGIWNDVRSEREALICQQQALYATAKLKETMLFTTTDNIEFEEFAVSSFSPFNLKPEQIATTKATNDFHLFGEKGDRILLMWLEDFEKWVIIQVDKQPNGYEFVSLDPLVGSASDLLRTGDIAPNMFTCKVVRLDPADFGSVSLSRPCVVQFIDYAPTETLVAEVGKRYGPGKWMGMRQGLPVYACAIGEQKWFGQTTLDVAKGDSSAFRLFDRNFDPSSVLLSAQCKFKAYKANEWAMIERINRKVVAQQIC